MSRHFGRRYFCTFQCLAEKDGLLSLLPCFGTIIIASLKIVMRDLKHIVIAAAEDSLLLDTAGPYEVFLQAEKLLKGKNDRGGYRITVASTIGSRQIALSGGLQLVSQGSVLSVKEEIDTLLIAGGGSMPDSPEKEAFVRWISETYGRVRRIGSICAGAFLLAEAGILNGRRAATHWMRCRVLSSRFPEVKVESDPIFIKDGNVYTSAGVSSGMDLALAMVEEDFGKKLALQVARQLVLFLRRPGSQSQFSALLSHQETDHAPIHETLQWIADHLHKPLTIDQMAGQAAMSPRNFARVFSRETGITPGKYLEKVRLEAARRRLEESRLTIEQIAEECGYGNADTMRRVFLKCIKTTPSEYRKIFHSAWQVQQ